MSNSIYAQSNEELFPNFPYFLFTPDELAQAKSRDRMHCKCACCGKEFWKEKHYLQYNIKHNKPLVYCSLKCANEYQSILSNNKLPDTYICEYCGKVVEKKDRYGSGRFCSVECARKYSNKFAITEDSNNLRKEKLREYHKKRRSVKKSRKTKVVQKRITSASIKELQKYWCLGDIIRKCKTTHSTIKKVCTEENYILDRKYVPLSQTKIVSACRYALAKPIELGSITYDDLKCVSDICSELLYRYNWSSERICTDFLGVYLPFRGSFSPTTLLKKMGVKTKNISESVHSFYLRHKIHKNKQPKEQYKSECLFHFEGNIYNLLFEFSEMSINKQKINEVHSDSNMISRDHMVSQDYGYKYDIDTYLISHPANCMLMPLSENITKRANCSLTLNELIERVEFFNETILYQDEVNIYNPNYKLNPKLSYEELKHYLNLSMID